MPQELERGPMELAIEQELLTGQLNTEQIDGANVTLDKIFEIKAGYHEALAHINKDERLSDAGRQVNGAQLKEATRVHYHEVTDNRLEGLDQRIAALTFQIRPQAPDTDPTRELLRQQELRAAISGWDELHLIEEYLARSVDGANDLFMRSVESAPLPLVTDPSILENGKRSRGMRESPEASQTLKQLSTVRAAIQSALDAALFELGLPDTTLEDIAQGTAAA